MWYLHQGHSGREIKPNNTHVLSQHIRTVLYPIHCHFQELVFMMQPESSNLYFLTSISQWGFHTVYEHELHTPSVNYVKSYILHYITFNWSTSLQNPLCNGTLQNIVSTKTNVINISHHCWFEPHTLMVYRSLFNGVYFKVEVEPSWLHPTNAAQPYVEDWSFKLMVWPVYELRILISTGRPYIYIYIT